MMSKFVTNKLDKQVLIKSFASYFSFFEVCVKYFKEAYVTCFRDHLRFVCFGFRIQK